MIEQIHVNANHEQNMLNGNEKQTTMLFSKIVTCCTCGMEMEFVENDVIFGEDWYHGKCWKATQERKRNV
jgi:hypothetical protein